MRFIVAYDICHPRRLKQVAKRLEQSAVRVQKSVFLYEGSRAELDAVCGDLMTLIDIHEDRVQAWGVHESHPTSALDGAMGHPSHALCVAISPAIGLVLGSDE
jgi:CRISPR-associated endonuclease Cas2